MSTMTASTTSATTSGKIADLHKRLAETRAPRGEEAIRQLHEAGRMTARDMVYSLLDDGSFVEIDALARHRSPGNKEDRPVTDGVVSGHGTVDGRPVCVFAQDASIFDGQVGEVAGDKILKVMQLAVKSGSPIVGIYHGAGTRVTEGMASLEAFTKIYRLQSRASGVIPQIAMVAGATSGAQVFGVSLSDVVVEVAGRAQLRLSEGDEASSDLDATSGTAHILTEDERTALDAVADVLAFLPSNNRAVPLSSESGEPCAQDLNAAIPDEAATTYDVNAVIDGIVDCDSVVELQPRYAPNMLTAFARVDGRSVGVLANQPSQQAGALDVDAAEKAARFVRLCDAFNVPLLSIVDVPGFQPNSGGEEAVVRRTAKLLGAVANASVGMISVITRKAYGTAYLALGAKRMGTDFVFAWPTAEIAAAEVDGASPYEAAARGLVDAVIPPDQTRGKIVEALRLIERKVDDSHTRKHDTIAF
ncbi:acyl-CoA carboxylase subunit beta [Corynebacterium heidelbergense]|uniref:Acyl-CoA carboxylase subunit beta n=2 Tax=Corynebacterium heidelbergense TaxID=2055947 RepID=A0A364VDV4_9CORY|nr:acyl-CoA carboxylase subunit beta [Corynebacterium heidelbergense]